MAPTATATAAPRDTPTPAPQEPKDRSSRLALAAFVAVLLSALVLYVVVGHRKYWFFQDEWNFLVERDAGSVDGLLRPHHDHWSTVPIVAYRSLWHVFGLNTYLPYQGLTIGLHLTAGALLRVVMRRAGVGPWIATAAAAMFVLLAGSGWMNIVWAFQLGFEASLVCGLAQLLLSDHDGPFDRRDALGVAFGVVGLMSSGVGVIMVFVVGLATLIRRGWRIAAWHVGPLAGLFTVWWIAVGRLHREGESNSIAEVPRFAWTAVETAFDKMGRLPGISLVLAGILLGGLLLTFTAARGEGRRDALRRAAMPLALLAGALLFVIMTALGRATEFGTEYATRPRFTHLIVALTVPALAVAADAVARRWRVVTPLLVVLFLIGIPRNVEDLWPRGLSDVVGDPDLVLSVAELSTNESIPRDIGPFDNTGIKRITVGWLRDGVESGQIPQPKERVSPDIRAEAASLVALRQVPDPRPTGRCRAFRAGTHRLEPGRPIKFQGSVRAVVLVDGGGRSSVRQFGAFKRARLEALAGPLKLELTPSGFTVECD